LHFKTKISSEFILIGHTDSKHMFFSTVSHQSILFIPIREYIYILIPF